METPPFYKLKDRSKTPHKGFRWKDPITGLEASGRNHANWLSSAQDIREANGLSMPVIEDMENELCASMGEKERADWCQVITGPEPKAGGPGTILKDLLSGFRIRACWGCLDLAGKMDTWGPDGCEENFQYIVNAMEANAQQRKWYRFIPFKETGITAIIRMAIAKSRLTQST